MTASQNPSQATTLDDVAIIWLDESVIHPGKELLSTRDNLFLSSVQSVRLFLDTSSCYEYIGKVKGMNILFVVSGSIGESFVPVLHDLPQITYIYVFCMDTSKHEVWANQWPKLRGVFGASTALSKRLKDDLRSLTEVILPFGVSDPQQRSLQNLTSEQSSFMWFQLIIETLLRLPHTPEAKADMVAECRLNYQENEVQLEQIKKFEETYEAEQALNWYTANSFVFHLFNKAFRRQDSETLFKYRFFLVDLLKQLGKLHTEQYKDRVGRLTVYRGQMMFRSELMMLRQSVNNLISINTFFSTSLSMVVAVNFSGNGEHEHQGIVSVIFRIDIDLAVQGRPFARIDQLSRNSDECEILFPIGTVFQVQSVDLDMGEICYVTLVWNQEATDKLNKMEHVASLTDFYTRQHIHEQRSVLVFGWFLSQMGLLRQAMRFYTYLRQTLPSDHPDRGVLYNNLGEVLRKMHYYHQARSCFEEALEFCADTMSIFHPVWAMIHSNIALLNLDCNKPKEALKFYRCALRILSRYNTLSDMEVWISVEQILAAVYQGMGAAFCQLNQIQDAIHFQKKALSKQLGVLPSDHPALIETYSDLGMLYVRLKNDSEALRHYEMALKNAELNLLAKDQRSIHLHLNIALLNLRIDQNRSKVLAHCSCVLEIMERTTLAASSSFCQDVYSQMTCLYFELQLWPLALTMWERFMTARKNQFSALSNDMDPSIVARSMAALQSSQSDVGQNQTFMIISQNRLGSFASMVQIDMVSLCEFADRCRTMGYITYAIQCYLVLLDNQTMTGYPHFDQVHTSRLHNNLAACYQDTADHDQAVHHYQSSLDILLADNNKKTMQAALTHYNIALVYIEQKDLNMARKHLHQSLVHFQQRQMLDTTSILDLKIYIALVKVYTRWNDWHTVRNYYERIVDQLKNDSAELSIIQRYETYLQETFDKINQTSVSSQE